MSVDGARPLVGGRYRIETPLGHGGMGAVFRVREEGTERRLALKRVAPVRDGQAQALERRRALLEREYHTLAQLAHPRIIEVYDYGVDQDGPYYTMELLDGADLRSRARLPWREAAAVLRDVASSLAILHSRRLLHRDVSARNVRCTTDGRAKLLDFGAMVPMGSVKDVVGTPPFVPPEALQMQALDARADLFALGALGYWVLVGRHAYSARSFAQLRDAWRSDPLPPVKLVPELPPELSSLVMQLLSLDRSARPQSAAEVIERLNTVADLPRDEQIQVSLAYLSTPTLIGRDHALTAVRRRVLTLARAEGCTVLVQGESGSGRSRFLDACVLEGKLLGVSVLRADASDGATEFGVTQRLARQLIQAAPADAHAAARLQRKTLAHAIPELGEAEDVDLSPPPERSRLLRDLRDWFLTVSNSLRVLLVVDDFDNIDEPSAALLSALAHKARKHPIALVLSATSGPETELSGPLRLVRELAEVIALEPLTAAQTETLMRSVFGDVTNLQVVADRVHSLCQGSPRIAMELAQHLVDRGLARYKSGSWALPAALDARDLPSSLSASLSTRLQSLSDDARALAGALCLAENARLSLADYPALTSHGEPARVYRALDELVAAGVLATDGERYRLSQRGFIEVITDALDAQGRRELHGRIARIIEGQQPDPIELARHLLYGGRAREANELLCGLDAATILAPMALLLDAQAASERERMPARLRHQLHHAILLRAPSLLAMEAFKEHLPPVLAQLEADSGLRAFRELGEELPTDERLKKALEITEARYQAAGEEERVYTLLDAITAIARLNGSFIAMGMLGYDLEYVESAPDLRPLEPLSKALTGVRRATEACKAYLSGRSLEGKRQMEELMQDMQQPDLHGFDPAQHKLMVLAMHYLLGLTDATMGLVSAEAHARALEADPAHRINAWRVRVAMHLIQGNADEAARCQRRAELLQIQSGQAQLYVGSSASVELLARALAGDLIGVKTSLEAVKAMATRFHAWRCAVRLGEAHYRRLQGDLPGALRHAEEAIAEHPPGRDPYWGYLAALHVDLLSILGQHNAAVARGHEYLEHCKRYGLVTVDRWVKLAQAQALARIGEFDDAIVLADESIGEGLRIGITGLTLGAAYEARARIAIEMNDDDAFDRYSKLCAQEYKKGRNPILSAKYMRLVEDARVTQISESLPPPGEAQELLEFSQTASAMHTVQSRLLECLDDTDRALCALTMLIEVSGCVAGHLFALREDHLTPLASLPGQDGDEALRVWLEGCVQAELEPERSATLDESEDVTSSEVPAARFSDPAGRVYDPIFLIARREGRNCIAGALALQFPPGPKTVPSAELLREIAEQMIEHGDATGTTLT